jgi:uncharacterized membrane protein
MKDTNLRSLIKGISWRVVGTTDTFFIAWIITGELRLAAPIAATEILTKVILFYAHERVWNLIKWGRIHGKVSHIRSMVKGISWRGFGSLDTMIISFVMTGNPFGAIKIGLTEVVTKIALFYLHERLWALIKWGRKFNNREMILRPELSGNSKSKMNVA